MDNPLNYDFCRLKDRHLIEISSYYNDIMDELTIISHQERDQQSQSVQSQEIQQSINQFDFCEIKQRHVINDIQDLIKPKYEEDLIYYQQDKQTKLNSLKQRHLYDMDQIIDDLQENLNLKKKLQDKEYFSDSTTQPHTPNMQCASNPIEFLSDDGLILDEKLKTPEKKNSKKEFQTQIKKKFFIIDTNKLDTPIKFHKNQLE